MKILKMQKAKWDKCKVKPKQDVKLSKIDTSINRKGFSKKSLKSRLVKDIEEISKLQNKLFAEKRQSLLIILQGMDSAGKDGTIKYIMSGVNPQGVCGL